MVSDVRQEPAAGAWTAIVARLVEGLPLFDFSAGDEQRFQAALAQALDQLGISYEREVLGGPASRFDFLCAHGVVIEAKVKGSLGAALSQVGRYCQLRQVNAVLLVTTRRWALPHKVGATHTLFGKAVAIVTVGGLAF